MDPSGSYVLYYKTIDSLERFKLYYTSLAEILPAEMIREIYRWLRHWNRRDATDRVIAFKANHEYRLCWSSIMTDIQMNIPRYIFHLKTRSGTPLCISIYSPDCDPELWPFSQQSEHPIITRRIGTIHSEFIRTQNSTSSIFL